MQKLVMGARAKVGHGIVNWVKCGALVRSCDKSDFVKRI